MWAAREEAGSIEEKLARLCFDEVLPPPVYSPLVSTASSSADAAVGAPLSPVLPDDEQICRICLEGAELPSHPLVQPCACRGSSTWAHADCLTRWRRMSPKAAAAYQCGQCDDDYRDALSLELLEERLRRQRVAHHPGMVSTMHELAGQLHAQGRFDQAAPFYREALQVSRKTLGDRHPSTLASMSNLATLLHGQGDLAGATPLCREALQVSRETLSNRHPDTIASINNLGMLLQDQGDLAGAVLLLREAVQVGRDTLGNRHPTTLLSINNLGTLLYSDGDLAGAAPLLREALQTRRETLGNRHPHTLASMNNTGMLLCEKGDLSCAAPLLREALQVSRETLGNQHPNTLTLIDNLGALLQKQGELVEALALLCELRELQTAGGSSFFSWKWKGGWSFKLLSSRVAG